MTLGVVGSRTWPYTREQFDALTEKQRAAAIREGRERVKVRVLRELRPGDGVVSGGAMGPDTWGEQAAKAIGHPTEVLRPDWNRLGKRAGFERNTTIVEKSNAILAFWDGVSHGTRDTIAKAHGEGKRVTVVFPDGHERSNAAA